VCVREREREKERETARFEARGKIVYLYM